MLLCGLDRVHSTLPYPLAVFRSVPHTYHFYNIANSSRCMTRLADSARARRIVLVLVGMWVGEISDSRYLVKDAPVVGP